MYNKHEVSLEEHNKFLKSLEHNDKKFFISFLKGDSLGIVSYTFYNENIEFAYYLKNEKDLNKGYGAVLKFSLLDHFFFTLKANSVVCEVLIKNKKTISLHKKFGFIEDRVYVDLEKTEEEICRLTIDLKQWKSSRKRIERIVNRIINIDKIGKIY